MKKIFLFIIAVTLLFACSKSEDNQPTSNIKISPPAWIQGE